MSQKREYQQTLRESQQRYEQQIKQLTLQLDQMQEKYTESDSSFKELEQKYDFERSMWEDKQKDAANSEASTNEQVQSLQKDIENLKLRSREQIEVLERDLAQERDNNKLGSDQASQLLKEKEDELKQLKSRFDTETAIFN